MEMGELLIVLENEYNLYQELLKLLQKEQEILVSGKGGTSPREINRDRLSTNDTWVISRGELLSVLEALERLVSEIQELETQKGKIVKNLSISYSLPVSDISLTSLCEVAEAPDAKKLLEIQVKMVKIMEQVKELNVCISYLSEKALEYATKLIEMFGAWGWTYHPNGRRAEVVRWLDGSVVRVFTNYLTTQPPNHLGPAAFISRRV